MSKVTYVFRAILIPIPFLVGELLGFLAKTFWEGCLDGWDRA